MALLLEKAKAQKGKTSPNPVTAAAVVQNGVVIAYGVHQGHGQPHAEVMALSAAGEAAKGSTVFVNLEPCTHYGRTPPCVKALIAAEVSEVVYAVDDPNPKVNMAPAGKILENAGIKVRSGLLKEEARRLNAVFFKNMQQNLPYVTLKAGISLDGKIALSNGVSKYITGPESQKQVHLIRREHDAILVGAGTVLADDPSLDVRFGLLESGFRNPTKIILDPQCLITPRFSAIVVRPDMVPLENGHFNWRLLLEKLYQQGICSILIEGGSKVFTSALEQHAVDFAHFFIAPKILGGKDDISVFSGKSKLTLAEVSQLLNPKFKVLGEDVWVSGEIL